MNLKIAKNFQKWLINKKLTIQDFITGYWYLPKKLGQQLRKQHGSYITTIIHVPEEPHDTSQELRAMTQEEAIDYLSYSSIGLSNTPANTANYIPVDTYTNRPEQNITSAELREIREQLNNYNIGINQDE